MTTHNPAGVEPGEGYRLLTVEELNALPLGCEFWNPSERRWFPTACKPGEAGNTYFHYRIKTTSDSVESDLRNKLEVWCSVRDRKENWQCKYPSCDWFYSMNQSLEVLKVKISEGWEVRLAPRLAPEPPKPKVRPWSKPEDVPGPVCWIRGKGDYRMHMIIGFAGENFYITPSCGCEPILTSSSFSETRWERMEHSTDRITWKPCTVETTEGRTND